MQHRGNLTNQSTFINSKLSRVHPNHSKSLVCVFLQHSPQMENVEIKCKLWMHCIREITIVRKLENTVEKYTQNEIQIEIHSFTVTVKMQKLLKEYNQHSDAGEKLG